MTPELKENWIKALRSGQYKQGRYALKNEEGNFCCLGVLAEIQGAVWTVPKDKRILPVLENQEEVLSMKTLSTDWMERCVEMNDRRGESFDFIADALERNDIC